jgi:cytochrome c-type biogenesis protein CcmF
MITELGHFALILALSVALLQAIVPAIGAQTLNNRLMVVASPAALCQLALVTLAFASLTHAYVRSDFSVLNVFENSHSDKPMLYKISGVWGNHEGSMLLWVLILSLFGAAVALFGRALPATLKSRVIAVQGLVGSAFLLFMVFASNPFARLSPAPIEGNGLNPLLQDPALAFHPPFLYAGYVGLSIAFSFAVAALLEGKVDAAWARWVRPWTIAAWMFLTLGIAMGSWWAYYELGWGGWWFWDPVENASLMPWLVATALIHSAIVVEKRNALKTWTLLLSILAFSLSLMGTFLVRSGVLTSVHAFAVDPQRGLFILFILLFFIGGSLLLYAWRAPALNAGGHFQPVSREGALVFNNLFLCAATVAVFVGTLYPLVTEAFGVKISVGPPYFNLTFGPLMLPLMLLVPIGALMSWKRADVLPVLSRLLPVAAFAASAALLTVLFLQRGPWLAVPGLALGFWLIAGSLFDLAQRIALLKAPFANSVSRFIGLPRASLGMLLAHAGLGVTIIGIVGMSLWRAEQIVALKPGEQASVGPYHVEFLREAPVQGPNYSGLSGEFRISRGDRDVTQVTSEKRAFKPSGMPTTEVGLYQTLAGDVYIALGDTSASGARVVRMYYNPLVNFIWLGGLCMFTGGILSLSDRKYRIGAPRTRARLSEAPAE